MREFILNLNAEFDENDDRAEIHRKIVAGKRLGEEDKAAIVAYLAFFEIVYRLISSDVIRIEVIDDLFRSRFFKAVHHKDVQDLELLPDADGYRNVYALEELWLGYLSREGVDLKRGDRPLPASARRRAMQQVHFSFSEADEREAGKVHDIVVAAADSMVPGTFFVNDVSTIARQMAHGLTVKGYRGDALAGILHVHFPSEEESHVRRVGGTREAAQVAHMDIAAVMPADRGYGLLGLLLIEAEARLREAEPERVALYATVHPDNVPSRRSFEFSGYAAVGNVTIHGSHPRIVFCKVL